MEKVEALVFPVLKEDFGKWMGENPSGVHIFESATILEKEFFRGFGDLVLIVTATFEVRLARAMERDNASESQVRARMQKQNIFMDISQLEHHCELPYVLCENAGTKEELRSNLAEIMVKQGLPAPKRFCLSMHFYSLHPEFPVQPANQIHSRLFLYPRAKG